MTAKGKRSRRTAAVARPESDTEARTPRVGLGELRRNLGALLRRVAPGERPEITDRGRPVALLVPTRRIGRVSPEMSPFEQLVAEGRATMPAGDLLDLPLPEGEPDEDPMAALDEEHADRL